MIDQFLTFSQIYVRTWKPDPLNDCLEYELRSSTIFIKNMDPTKRGPGVLSNCDTNFYSIFKF